MACPMKLPPSYRLLGPESHFVDPPQGQRIRAQLGIAQLFPIVTDVDELAGYVIGLLRREKGSVL